MASKKIIFEACRQLTINIFPIFTPRETAFGIKYDIYNLLWLNRLMKIGFEPISRKWELSRMI